MKESPEFAGKWLEQWKRASVELARVHRTELAGLSQQEALAASDSVLSMPVGVLPRERWIDSGLVAQQRSFALLRQRRLRALLDET
jgi:hypothetical protein